MSAGLGEPVRLVSPGGALADVSPALGFNCVRLALVPVDGRDPVDVVHAEPDALRGGSPTRSGIPVLFPFPNRIAGASFDAGGRRWDLPRTHPGDPNAIHGYACRAAWSRYERTGPGSVTGRFALDRDTADPAQVWPGALELTLTYALSDRALAIVAEVANRGDEPAPFGLGLHAYLRPLAGAVERTRVWCGADERWLLADGIPTGELAPVDDRTDLRSAPALGDRSLDEVLTGLPAFAPGPDGLMERAAVLGDGLRLALRGDASFREIVVFTPPNRESVAVEPYTCPTDAVHLQRPGRDLGWRTLAPGESWRGVVHLTLDAPGPDGGHDVGLYGSGPSYGAVERGSAGPEGRD
ncbi:MAG: hypothetical protein R2737_00750 [Candidatus Nanopelagicales bacterium]